MGHLKLIFQCVLGDQTPEFTRYVQNQTVEAATDSQELSKGLIRILLLEPCGWTATWR